MVGPNRRVTALVHNVPLAIATIAGNLMSQELRKKGSGDSIAISNARSELLGFLKLLKVARVSAEAHCADGACVALLDECMSSLMQRNGVSAGELQRGVTAAEFMQIPTLLRALTYACAEAQENLDEPHSAALLAKCISFIRATWSCTADEQRPQSSRLYN
jgi:hypothetical protein